MFCSAQLTVQDVFFPSRHNFDPENSLRIPASRLCKDVTPLLGLTSMFYPFDMIIFFPIYFNIVELLVVYRFQKFPKNALGKYKKHEFLGLSSGKFPGATEHVNEGSPVFRTDWSKRKFKVYFFKAIFDNSFRPSRGRFSVSGTDLYK